MKIQRPLFWHQGLFLQPQHLQLQDRFVQSQLIPFLKYQQPYFWGACSAEIDEGGLGTGSFALDSGSFLFQDGTYVEFPGNALCAARRFGTLQEGRPLRVYLGLRRWDPAGQNVAVIDSPEEAGSSPRRFLAMADPEEVRDQHGSGPDGQVKRLQHLLKLFWEDELDQLGDYHLIPLARLHDAGGGITSSASFVPPCVTIGASPTLMKLVREIRDHLAARSRQLAEYKKQRGVHNGPSGHRDTVYLLALRTLNRHVPHFFHLTESGLAHPWNVYGSLRELVGELSSFSLRVDALGESPAGEPLLPPYDHTRLWDCFSAARELVTQLLQEVTAGPQHVIPLLKDGAAFVGQLAPSLLEGGKRYFLALKTEQDPKLVIQALGSLAKLSSRQHVTVLASRALPGLSLEYLQVPPEELPRRPHTLFFEVDHHHVHWEMVAKAHDIALYWDCAPEDLEVELMVV